MNWVLGLTSALTGLRTGIDSVSRSESTTEPALGNPSGEPRDTTSGPSSLSRCSGHFDLLTTDAAPCTACTSHFCTFLHFTVQRKDLWRDFKGSLVNEGLWG